MINVSKGGITEQVKEKQQTLYEYAVAELTLMSIAKTVRENFREKKCPQMALESHTCTVVRGCFKGDEASQRKRPNFDPSLRKNSFTDLHKIEMLITVPGMEILLAISSGICAPQIRDFALPQGETSFFRFLGVLQ